MVNRKVPKYLKNYRKGGNTGKLIGTALGAGIGTAIAPGIGTTVGTSIGSSVGSLADTALGKREERPEFEFEDPAYQDRLNYKGSLSKGNSTMYYRKGGSLKDYERGGKVTKAPAMSSSYEVEGEEVVEGGNPLITGGKGEMSEEGAGMFSINGPQHEEGGVEATGGERVFSDKLKIPGTKKTYAEAAKEIGRDSGQKSMEKKLDKKPYDPILKKSLSRVNKRNEAQKDALFNIQEASKEADADNQEMAQGGKLPGYKGGGRTIKYAGGGNLPKYQDGSYTPPRANLLPYGYETDMPAEPGSNASGGRPATTGPSATPFSQYLTDQLMEQSGESEAITGAARVAQTIPALYDMARSRDRDYTEPIYNPRRNESIRELENMPTEFNIDPQLRSTRDAFRESIDAVGRYSASPQVTRANIARSMGQRIRQENKLQAQKENRENELEANKRRSLSQQRYNVGQSEAQSMRRNRLMNQRTESRAESMMGRGLSSLSTTASKAALDKQNRLRDTERRALTSQLIGDRGIQSRMTSDPGYLEAVRNADQELYSKLIQNQTLTIDEQRRLQNIIGE